MVCTIVGGSWFATIKMYERTVMERSLLNGVCVDEMTMRKESDRMISENGVCITAR